MTKIFLISFVFFSFNAYSLTSLPPMTKLIPEAWIKFSCVGVTSPRDAFPTIERAIVVGHIKFDGNGVYPSFESLRDQNSSWFRNFTKVCTERRRARVELGSFSGSWLDWGTDWGYSRLEQSEVAYSFANQNACREPGSPCERASQCCGYSRYTSSCNLSLNTCESTMIDVSTNNQPSSL